MIKKIILFVGICVGSHHSAVAMQQATVTVSPGLQQAPITVNVNFDIPLILRRLVAHAGALFIQDPQEVSVLVAVSDNLPLFGVHCVMTEEESLQVSKFNLTHPIHFFIFNEKRFKAASLGLKKAGTIHEFCHLKQYDPITKKRSSLNPAFHDEIEKDADFHALLNLGCIYCMREFFAAMHNDRTSKYLSKSEALELIPRLKYIESCDYHRELCKITSQGRIRVSARTIAKAKTELEHQIAVGHLQA